MKISTERYEAEYVALVARYEVELDAPTSDAQALAEAKLFQKYGVWYWQMPPFDERKQP